MYSVLRKTLEQLTRETGLVGGVVALFRDGRIFFTDAYGWADREAQRPMTLNCSFDIASCSKAFTVMLAAQAVDDGLIGWDQPIRDVMPAFDMLDPYAGAHMSIRDLASHRSGLPCHDFLRQRVGGSRENLMRVCARLDPTCGFREKYQYNNHMYIVLGYLDEVLRGGESWEHQVRTRIADPLGIGTIRFRGVPGNMDDLERALPYASDGFAAHRCAYSDSPLSGPCGGIKVNVLDLCRWVMAMARGGVCESGQRLCSEAQYREIFTPVIPTPEENEGRMQGVCYALGWHTGVYNGHPVCFHSGGLEGFNTQVGFLPGENCGYAAIFNTGSTPTSEIVRNMALDVLTDGHPQDDYTAALDDWKTRRDRMRAELAEAQDGDPVTAESDPALVGTFEHPGYEYFEITPRDGRLWFCFGDFEVPLLRRKKDGLLCGYSGTLDGLTPDHVELYPDGSDLLLRTSDSALRMHFVRK